jgi:DNA invertase Pin-like site-specific DNA recombinase
MRVAAYARVSTDRQQLAQTIQQQVELLLAYVRRQLEWVLDEEHIFRDDGYSGARLQRPGLDALRDQVARAAFDVVVITAPDRLARHFVHQMVVLDEWERAGIEVVFIDRPPSRDPHEQLVAVCASVFGLRISEGAIAAALARLAARAQPEVDAIREAVRASPAINSDETGVRVDGRNWWHWVFQMPTASYHVIAPSRGADVVERFLGEARPQVWGSDAFPTQFAAPAKQHQLCLSHQIRDLTYAVEADGPAGARWARELRHVFGRALRLHRERGRVTPATFDNRRIRIERAADRLILGVPIGVGEAWQLQKRYRRHRDKLFVCLHRDDVEPTNNGSERDLRNSVIHDKVTGGYRSRRGAEQGAIFATLLTTARKLGQNAYARLCAIAGPSPLHAAGLAT